MASGGFKRDLSEDEMKSLLHSGGSMAASMRQVLATASERMGRLREVNEALRAKAEHLQGDARSAVAASLKAVSGSMAALQASLKMVEAAVSETHGVLESK